MDFESLLSKLGARPGELETYYRLPAMTVEQMIALAGKPDVIDRNELGITIVYTLDVGAAYIISDSQDDLLTNAGVMKPARADRSSGLPSAVRRHEGHLLWYMPTYGWGWARYEDGRQLPMDFAQVDRAGPFAIRVDRFFSWWGQLRGIIGRVEQPGHLFQELWAVTYTMLVGEFDLAENLCHRWDIELTRGRPRAADRRHRTGLAYNGHGVLAESLDVLARESMARAR